MMPYTSIENKFHATWKQTHLLFLIIFLSMEKSIRKINSLENQRRARITALRSYRPSARRAALRQELKALRWPGGFQRLVGPDGWSRYWPPSSAWWLQPATSRPDCLRNFSTLSFYLRLCLLSGIPTLQFLMHFTFPLFILLVPHVWFFLISSP
jgi:hypothetical protein